MITMRKILAIVCAAAVAAGTFWSAAPAASAAETGALKIKGFASAQDAETEDAASAAEDNTVPAEGDASEAAAYDLGSPAEEAEDADTSVPDPEIAFSDKVKDAREALKDITDDHEVTAVVYLVDEFTVRATPSQDGETVVTVPGGQTVYIQDVTLDENGQAWAYVSLYYDEVLYSGFITRSNLVCADQAFLDWEAEYGMNPSSGKTARRSYAAIANPSPIANTSDVAQFPASYQSALNALKKAHPNWTFVKQTVNLNWDTVVANELTGDRNLVSGSSFGTRWRNELYGQSWYQVSEATLEYYLDPRNWLDESHIFLFEQLTYNGTYYTKANMQSFLTKNTTFLGGALPASYKAVAGEPNNYAEIFIKAGENNKVSPFHLASRVNQEQSKTSPLISGTYSGFAGYYNYFNVGSTGKTNEQVIKNGLTYARDHGWNSPYKSINGGAAVIAQNYIKKGQDTLYLEKFDVDASYNGLYSHQYMQNISAPHVEGRNTYNAYKSAGLLNTTFIFKIPVYNNMPSAACKEPSANTSVLVSKPSGYSDTTVYIDGVGYSSVKQGGKLLVTAPSTGSKAVTMYKYDSAGVPTGMYVWTLGYNSTDKKLTTTAVSGLSDLLLYQGFSIRITGDTGIRCMTSISKSVRSKLTGSGISGYKLKEYGTLVMTKANTSKYPLVKGGTAVGNGMAYGTSGGKHIDAILQTTNGRYWYTSVLTKLPVEQYKTPFTFRGYIILTKGGQNYTIYGPAMSGSMYGLATYIVNSGAYKKGSSEDKFLRNIISKAK